jgi:hypothetical protein
MSRSNAPAGSALFLAAVPGVIAAGGRGHGHARTGGPAEQLVIGGLYRYVRNLMCVAPAPALTQAPSCLSACLSACVPARYAVAST